MRANYREIKYLVSYDGRTGDRVHGRKLPDRLRLHLIELQAGRSSQATLLGRAEVTVESLYLIGIGFFAARLYSALRGYRRASRPAAVT